MLRHVSRITQMTAVKASSLTRIQSVWTPIPFATYKGLHCSIYTLSHPTAILISHFTGEETETLGMHEKSLKVPQPVRVREGAPFRSAGHPGPLSSPHAICQVILPLVLSPLGHAQHLASLCSGLETSWEQLQATPASPSQSSLQTWNPLCRENAPRSNCSASPRIPVLHLT